MTYNDLYNIMRCGIGKGKIYCSGNTFTCEQGKKYVEQIEKLFDIGKSVQESFGLFDLQNCNFSQEEKDLLRKKLQYMNLVLWFKIQIMSFNEMLIHFTSLKTLIRKFVLNFIIES